MFQSTHIHSELKKQPIKLSAPISVHAQYIFEQTTLQPFDGSEKSNLYQLPIERPIHGSQHASRVAILVLVIINFLKSLGHKRALALSKNQIKRLQIVALFHDTGRKGDREDHPSWEEISASNCKDYLIRLGTTEKCANKYARLITSKQKGGFLGRVFQSADCIDIPRVREIFKIDKISILKDIEEKDMKELFEIIIDNIFIIADQNDLTSSVCLQYKGFEVATIRMNPTYSFSNAKPKQTYEQAENCYEKTVADFKSCIMISKYLSPHPITQPLNQSDLAPQEDGLLKSVNPNCFWPFILGITKSPSQQDTFFIRIGDHKTYTAYNHYSGPRSDKISLHTKDQKRDYSQHQSTTLITANGKVLAFSFPNMSRGKSFGIIFDPSQSLLNRMSPLPLVSVLRPYESYSKKDVENFRKLHLPETIGEFKSEIKKNGYSTNEVLAGLRFDIKSTKMAVLADTLEARCLSQDAAKRIRRRLEKQFSELGLTLDPAYQIPIIFYLPRKIKHYTYYDLKQQIEDKKTAQAIFDDVTQRTKAFNYDNFEFLLLINNPEEILYLKHNKMMLFSYLISMGHFGLAEALHQNIFDSQCSSEYWKNNIKEIVNETDFQNLEYNALHRAVETGNLKFVQAFINLYPKLIDEMDLLYLAIENKRIHIAEYLIKAGADVNIDDEEGNTLLHEAVKNDLYSLIPLLIEHGASVLQQNKFGEMPIFFAVKLNSNYSFCKLLDYNSPITIKDANKRWLLTYIDPTNEIMIKLFVDRLIKNIYEVMADKNIIGYCKDYIEHGRILNELSQAAQDQRKIILGNANKFLVTMLNFLNKIPRNNLENNASFNNNLNICNASNLLMRNLLLHHNNCITKENYKLCFTLFEISCNLLSDQTFIANYKEYDTFAEFLNKVRIARYHAKSFEKFSLQASFDCYRLLAKLIISVLTTHFTCSTRHFAHSIRETLLNTTTDLISDVSFCNQSLPPESLENSNLNKQGADLLAQLKTLRTHILTLQVGEVKPPSPRPSSCK